MANGVGNARRLRDLGLVVCSLILQGLAIGYTAPWLAWLGAGLFWLAVLDATRGQPRGSRIVAAVASGFLLALAVIVVTVLFLTSRPAVERVAPAVPTLPPSDVTAPR